MKKIYVLPSLCTALNVFAGTFSIIFEKSYAQSNLISLVIEIVLGAILVI